MSAKVRGLLALGAFALVATGTAQAQIQPYAGCAQAKQKCEIGYIKGKLGCEAKAAKLGVAVDSLCSAKASAKFNTAGTGCMAKAETKFPVGPTPCNAYLDATTEAGRLDAFVANLKSIVYTNPGPNSINACAAATYKCAAGLQAGMLGCDNKGIKLGANVDSLCVTKVLSKFTNSLGKGCMDKLDVAGKACTLTGRTGQAQIVLANTLASVADTACAQAPLATTFVQQNQAGSGSCGTVTPGTPIGQGDGNLACGFLYIGGGAATVPAGATPPGTSTKFNMGGAGDRLCARTAAQTGSNRSCTDVACKFGSPLPIVNGPLSTCVDNHFSAKGGGQVIPTTGESIANLPLESTVTVTGNGSQPCPHCVAGSCDASAANPGAGCTADATTGESHDCVAQGTTLPSFLVPLSPMTSGTASKTAASGIFCPEVAQANAGAFGDGTVTSITTVGAPAGDLTSGGPKPGTLGSVFCIPATGNLLIDGSADLPGPGAVTLPVTVDIL